MRKIKRKNKKGYGFLTSLIVGIMGLFFFLALTPAIVKMFGISKGSDGANCPGYTDPDTATLGANNKSYDTTKDTDTLTCTIVNFGPGMIVLAVIFGVVAGIISGNLGRQEQQNPYAQYGQY